MGNSILFYSTLVESWSLGLFVILLILKHVCALSCTVVSDSLQSPAQYTTRLLCPRDSPDKNTGVGCHDLHCVQFWMAERKLEERKNISWHVKFKFQCPWIQGRWSIAICLQTVNTENPLKSIVLLVFSAHSHLESLTWDSSELEIQRTTLCLTPAWP